MHGHLHFHFKITMSHVFSSPLNKATRVEEMVITHPPAEAPEMNAYINCFKCADNDLCKLQCSKNVIMRSGEIGREELFMECPRVKSYIMEVRDLLYDAD